MDFSEPENLLETANMQVELFSTNITVFILIDPQFMVIPSILREYYVCLGVEMLIIILSIFVKSIALWVQMKFGTIHKNLIRILQVVTVIENSQNASQFLLILVQLRVIPLHANVLLDLLVFMCSLLRCCMLESRTFMLACFVAERAFSVYYLCDYEKQKRRWIWMSIIAIHCLLAFIYALLSHFLPPEPMMYLVTYSLYVFLTLIGLFSLLYLWLLRANRQKSAVIRNSNAYKEYTLSVRFQLQENRRAFQIMSPIYISMAVNTLVLCFLSQCNFWFGYWIGYYFPVMILVIDIYFVGGDVAAQIIYLFVNRSYRESFFMVLGEILSLCSLRYTRFTSNRSPISDISRNGGEHQGGDLYFDQFKAAWA